MLKKKLTDFFIPHAENQYAPHSLQKAAMVAMLFLVVLSFTATNALSLIWISSHTMISSVLPAVIVDLTNGERDTASLGILSRNSVLDIAAQLKAEDMAKNSYFAHYSPAGVSPWHWFGIVGYNFVHAGENLAIHFSDSDDIVDAWMASPSHRANIMNGNYTEIGIGTAEGTYQGFKTIYVVQLFGTPAAPVVATIIPVPQVAGETIDIASSSASSTSKVLAQAVSLTETIEIIPAEPEPADITLPASTTASNTPPSSIAVVVAPTDVAEAPKTENRPTLYSDFISTSTGGIPASVIPKETDLERQAPFLLEIATQPHRILQILYIIIGLFVGVCLILSIFIEIRYQQPRQIAYGVGLIVLMCMLFYMHTMISTGALVI